MLCYQCLNSTDPVIILYLSLFFFFIITNYLGIGCGRVGRNTRFGVQGLRFDSEGSQRDFSCRWYQVSGENHP